MTTITTRCPRRPRRSTLLTAAIGALLPLALNPPATAAVDRQLESGHHDVITGHDLNICGNLATFTFDVTWHATGIDTGVDTGGVYVFDYTEAVTYTVDFDDPALATWTGHDAETFHFVSTPGGTVLHSNYNGWEGPVQIIEHLQIHTDADGNVAVDRYFERHIGC
jgi:hypothetical protein